MTFEYKMMVTGDGSPTFCLPPAWEHMHAEEGAFTETLYIYGPPVEKAFAAARTPVFLSLGLGLAYNEMLIAFEALGRDTEPGKIASCESVPELREAFRRWLGGSGGGLGEIYDRILALYAEKYGRDGAPAKALLARLLAEGRLALLGPVEESEVGPSHAILFDPFSAKTSPALWTPEFLERFFQTAAAETCFVSTYAANGTLKRALKKNGFTLEVRKGFGRKRESTFASKGVREAGAQTR